MKQPVKHQRALTSKATFGLKAAALVLSMLLLATGYMFVVQYYLSDNQQETLRPYENANVNSYNDDNATTVAVTIDQSFVRETLKTLPNLSLLTTDILKDKNIQTFDMMPTAVPARALFDYQPNDQSGTHHIQPSMTTSLTELFIEAKSKNYPLYITSSYISLSELTAHTEREAEPPAGYNLRHTGYMVSLGCGAVRGDQFNTSICSSWLMRDNASVARHYGLLPLQWMNESSSSNYSDQDFLWLGVDNLRDFQNVIE